MPSPIDRQNSNERDGLFKPLSRVASVIVPNTGEFIHRTAISSRAWTLRSGDTTPGDYDSETEFLLPPSEGPTHRTRFHRLRRRIRWVKKKVALVNHPIGRKMIKCGLAYWIGSLACLIPEVSRFLGRSRNKHLVATVSVYFNPAKTRGDMGQATQYAFLAFAYSTIVDLLSMSLAAGFDELGLIQLSHIIILVVFCAGGLGLIGWSKHYMANPLFGTACSLASTSIITVLTKENALIQGDIAWQVLRQNTITVIMAVLISNLVCHLLWPIYAVDEMKDIMVKSTDAFSTMLSLITKAFLEGSEQYIRDAEFEDATSKHRAVFTSLPKKLVETKYEHYLKGEVKEYEMEVKLVECMQRIAQHIGGLRSAASTQFYLLKMNEKQKERNPNYIPSAERLRTRLSELSIMGEMFSPPENESPLASRLASSRGSTLNGRSGSAPIIEEGSSESSAESEDVCPIEIFEQFIGHLGPPMKSLAFTMKTILDQLPFSKKYDSSDYEIDINPHFRPSLVSAIDLFAKSRTEALEQLYATPEASLVRDVGNAADIEEILAACSYFSFCLEDLAQELVGFLDILHDLDYVIEHPHRSWDWLKFWKRFGKKKSTAKVEAPRATAHLTELLKFPAKTKTIPNVAQNESIPFTYKIWRALKLFRRDDVRFGIKVGLGAGLFALPAFIPKTRPFYSEWHGEWGLVSYMVVMSLTQGQTNTSSFYRVLGTVIGAFLAIISWTLFANSPVLLSFAGFLISLPCFYIVLTWKQGTFGRFILLTYNLSALYAYTVYLEDKPYDPNEGELDPVITQIAFHRTVSVIAGVLWALLINKQIWPISARKKLRGGLSLLWLRLALIWSRDPLSPLLSGNDSALDLLRNSDHGLQRALLKIQGYLDQAPHEFRLKGPFPVSEYKTIIACTQSILDAVHGLSVVVSQQKKDGLHPVLLEVLEETRRERRDLATRLGHLFYVLASSMQLTFPLPEALPKTENVRDRVLAKVGQFRKERLGEVEGRGEKELEIVFTYVLVTGKIATALEECIRMVGRLYGRLEEEMLEI